MTSERTIYKLGDCVTFLSGGTPTKQNSTYWGGDIPWISATSMYTSRIQNSSEKITWDGLQNGSRLAKKLDFLLLVRGSALHQRIPMGICTRDVAFNQDVKSLRSSQEVLNPWYLYFWFLGKEEEILNMVELTGIGAGKLDTDRLKNMDIEIPSLDYQQKVVDIIKVVEDLIFLNVEINNSLKSIAMLLFRSWFVDIDSSVITSERNQSEASTDSDFSINWKRVKVKDIATANVNLLTLRNPLKSLKYIEISEVSEGYVNNISVYKRGEEPSRARRLVKHGDIVISTVRPDRKSYFLALQPPDNLVASTGFAVITPTKVPWSFLYSALIQEEFFKYLGVRADGGAYPSVNSDVIMDWEVNLPQDSSNIVHLFDNITAPFYKKIHSNNILNDTLLSIRNKLINELILSKRINGGVENGI